MIMHRQAHGTSTAKICVLISVHPSSASKLFCSSGMPLVLSMPGPTHSTPYLFHGTQHNPNVFPLIPNSYMSSAKLVHTLLMTLPTQPAHVCQGVGSGPSLARTQRHMTLPIGYHLKLNGTLKAVAVYVRCLLYVLYLIVQLGHRTQPVQNALFLRTVHQHPRTVG